MMKRDFSIFADKVSLALESILSGAYFTLERFQKHNLGLLGNFAFIFLPVLDTIRAILYWQKLQNKTYRSTKDKTHSIMTLMLHVFKAMVTTTAVVLIIIGFAPIGFCALVAANAMMSLRSLGKAFYALYSGKYHEAGRHLIKGVVSGLFSAAFAVTFLFPSVVAAYPFLGFALAIGAAVIGLAAWAMPKTPTVIQHVAVPTPALTTEDCNKLRHQCTLLKKDADESLKRFEARETETVGAFLNRSNNKTLENKIKAIIEDFVDGELNPETNTRSPSELLSIDSYDQSPYYTKGNDEVITKLKDGNEDQKASASSSLKHFYFNEITRNTVCNLVNKSYAYNPNILATSTERNPMATKILPVLLYEPEFQKYLAYNALSRGTNSMCSSMQYFSEENITTVAQSTRFDILKGEAGGVKDAVDNLKKVLDTSKTLRLSQQSGSPSNKSLSLSKKNVSSPN